MQSHLLTNFETANYYQNERKFHSTSSIINLHKKGWGRRNKSG